MNRSVLGRFSLVLVAFALGCTPKPSTSEQKPESAEAATQPTWPRTTTHAGLEAIELFPNGANERSPLVVAIHGLGDRPQHWVEGWRSFPAKAQIVLPRGFTAYGDGYSWFSFSRDRTPDELAAEIGASETKLWTALQEIAAGRKIIVTGFSQGGMLSYAIAARHPNEVVKAFPISGFCPRSLTPKGRAAPVLALHGGADPLVLTQWDRDSVAAFKASGNEIELREYPDVPHTITPQMRKDWWDALAAAVRETN